MIRAVFLGAIALACVSVPADARPRQIVAHPDCNITMPCEGVTRSARGERIAKAVGFGVAQNVYEVASRPAGFIRGRLVCAVNVGAELARRGIRGTGSALAKSYLPWGRASGPVPGAVAVFDRGRRGGHVAIVHSVRQDGTVIYLNPSSRRQAWQIGPYHKRPIAFRVAGY